jgi:hypothetical protein
VRPPLNELLEQVAAEHGATKESLIADVEAVVLAAAQRAWPGRALEVQFEPVYGKVDLHQYVRVVEAPVDGEREIGLAAALEAFGEVEPGDELGVQIFWRAEDAQAAQVQDRAYGAVTPPLGEAELASIRDAFEARCDELLPLPPSKGRRGR